MGLGVLRYHPAFDARHSVPVRENRLAGYARSTSTAMAAPTPIAFSSTRPLKGIALPSFGKFESSERGGGVALHAERAYPQLGVFDYAGILSDHFGTIL
jgi:hypothetical protein